MCAKSQGLLKNVCFWYVATERCGITSWECGKEKKWIVIGWEESKARRSGYLGEVRRWCLKWAEKSRCGTVLPVFMGELHDWAILKRERERKYRMSMVNVIGFSLRSALTEEKGEKGNCFPFIWPPSLSSATSDSPSVCWEEALLGI